MIGTIIVGAIIGAIAGKIMHTHHGLLLNILVGIVGSSVGHALVGFIGIHATGIAGVMVDILGACVVISVARKIG